MKPHAVVGAMLGALGFVILCAHEPPEVIPSVVAGRVMQRTYPSDRKASARCVELQIKQGTPAAVCNEQTKLYWWGAIEG